MGMARPGRARAPEAQGRNSTFAGGICGVLRAQARGGEHEPIRAAQPIEQAFAQFPHWETSEAQESEVHRAVLKALTDAGVEAVAEVADKLMRLLRRAGR